VSGSQLHLDDTIGALATAPGPAARGIVRISGPGALRSLDGWFEPEDVARWKSARVALSHPGRLRLAGLSGGLQAIVYAWPSARSYTAQPVVEIHAPGSPPLLEAILARVFEAGVRPAHRGEFTLRAFLAGRLDLVQAEAVLGVIDAGGDADLAAALRQLAGGISARMASVQGDLIDLLADLEAGLDFVDEGIEFVARTEVSRRILAAEAAVMGLLEQCQERSQSLARRRVVLAGLPNAGKSTLFNALLSRNAALVSPIAGTTRDYLCGSLEWSGMPIELIDTPGWEREEADNVGRPQAVTLNGLTLEAQQLGAQQRRQADLILWCAPLDASEAERSNDAQLQSRAIAGGRPVIVVATKIDRIAPPRVSRPNAGSSAVSAKTGEGLAELIDRCVDILANTAAGNTEILGTTAARCRESLASTCESLSRAGDAAASGMGDEFIALELRESLDHLGRVLGTVYTDDILDRIFSRFCIGK
jgi:tRNA modification GTPase